MKHGSEKRRLELITRGKEKMFRAIWTEESLEDIFPVEQVEVEGKRRRQARKRGKEEGEELTGRTRGRGRENFRRRRKMFGIARQMVQRSTGRRRCCIC